MRNKHLYLAGYALYWLFFFIFFKAVFLVYQYHLTAELSITNLFGVFWHGLAMDISFTAYVVALPFLVIAVDTLIGLGKGKWLKPVLRIYTAVVLFILTLLCTSDLELYQAWGFRLDDSPLNYLNTPKEMMASVGAAPLWLLTSINIAVNIAFSLLYKHTLHTLLPWRIKSYRIMAVPYLVLTGSLIIAMRGGLQTIPLNQSTVFFSGNYYTNQAALNVAWNFAHALGKRKTADEHPYLYLPASLADSLVKTLYYSADSLLADSTSADWLTTTKPNIILLIWESFTAKVAEPLGGTPGVTPNFTQLCEEGLLFTNVIASSDRSDKGLVAILSGYPAQPNATIIKEPKKNKTLPQLSINLKDAGYYNTFYYGGELDFANLRSFLRFGAWNTLVSDNSFAEEDRNSKWGAHDGVVANRLKQDLNTFAQPFFTTWFTLSSHEPFEIPMRHKFGKDNNVNQFLSSHYYTDSVVGNFVAHAKNQTWWDNTLLIIIADHGHPLPNNSQGFEKNKFTIPMLWLGGALQNKGKYHHTISQTDLAAMLLNQLNLANSEYTWSKNPVINQKSFAQYVFKDGFGFVTDSSYVVQENIGRTIVADSGQNIQTIKLGQAHLQKSYQDYLER